MQPSSLPNRVRIGMTRIRATQRGEEDLKAVGLAAAYDALPPQGGRASVGFTSAKCPSRPVSPGGQRKWIESCLTHGAIQSASESPGTCS